MKELISRLQLDKKKVIALVIFVLLLVAIPVTTYLVSKTQIFRSRASEIKSSTNKVNYYGNLISTFGLFGKKDLGSATRLAVTNKAAYHGSGVIVDTSSIPNKIYFADSGNNRILGFNGGDGIAKSADIVIGQPDMNSGNCNGDSNLGYKKAPTASTLCLMAYPGGNNTSEQWGGKNLDVDSEGDLYVPDLYNNRVLEYYQPFSQDKTGGKGDSVADVVYGQPDFTINDPSKFNNYQGWPIGGVSADPFDQGVWVAEPVNGRVLHYPQGSKTADVILGKKGCDSQNSTTNMCSPLDARVNSDTHELYVIDQWSGLNTRFMVFTPGARGNFQSGQAASRVFKPQQPRQSGVNDSMFDANGYIFNTSGFAFNKNKKDYPTGFIWINEHPNDRALLLDNTGNVLLALGSRDIYHGGGDYAYQGCPTDIYQGNKFWWPNGSIGQDSDNNIYIADEYTGRVIRYAPPYTTYQNNGVTCPPEGDASLLQRGWNVPSADTLGESLGLTVFGNQLIVQDEGNTRKVWNDYTTKSWGSPADITVTGGMAGTNLMSSSIDDANRLWTYGEHGEIRVYKLPFTSNNAPIADFVKLYWIDDETEVNGGGPSGIAFDKINKAMYFGYGGARILRVKNYNDLLTGKLKVDMVLGQTSKTAITCNQGLSVPTAQTLCTPYQIKFDNYGNLFVVDNHYECGGNKRIVVFTASDLQGATSLFPNLSAKKIFNEPDFTTTNNCAYWVKDAPGSPVSIAFNSKNQMIIGNDGYYEDSSQRELKQLWFYNDPLNKQTPDASINLYMGTPGEITFDADDNLLIQDHTWYRVSMINLCTDPSWLYWLPGVTPVSACNKPNLTPTPGTCISKPACLNLPNPCTIIEPAEGWCPGPEPTIFPKNKIGFSLSPANFNVGVNEKIEIPLYVRSDSDVVNLFVAKLSFPTDFFEMNSVDVQNSFISNWIENNVDQALGIVSLAGGVPTPGFQTKIGSSAGYMAKIIVTTKKAGKATISFSNGTAIYRNSDNTNILAAQEGITLDIADISIAKTAISPSPSKLINSPSPIISSNGDINGDGKVDLADLSVLLSRWNKSDDLAGKADLNSDGVVNTLDYSFMTKILLDNRVISK